MVSHISTSYASTVIRGVSTASHENSPQAPCHGRSAELHLFGEDYSRPPPSPPRISQQQARVIRAQTNKPFVPAMWVRPEGSQSKRTLSSSSKKLPSPADSAVTSVQPERLGAAAVAIEAPFSSSTKTVTEAQPVDRGKRGPVSKVKRST